jgi:hypothetical protein
MMRRALFAIVLAVLTAASAVPAAAHVPATPPLTAEIAVPQLVVTPESVGIVSAAPAPMSIPWAVIAVGALAALALSRRPRRAVALLLVVVSAVLAFETGVHSAHHLGTDARSCSVASVAAQLSGIVDGTVVYDTPYIAPVTAIFPPDVAPFVSGVLLPDVGRAPPLASA